MKKLLTVAALVLSPMLAQATPCDEVKAAIAAKIDAKGVKSYELTVVPTEEAANHPDKKEVGVCEAGKMKILYKRN